MISDLSAHGEHLVQFYRTDDFLCDTIADFVAHGLRRREPVLILCTRDHRDGVRSRIDDRHGGWEASVRRGDITWLDAREVLEMVMIGRVPDRRRFDAYIGERVRWARRRAGEGGRVRAYGELVDLLWREGHTDAALLLEDMWNDLARTDPFSLLCAYSNVRRETDSAFRHVCDRHTGVLPHEPD